MLRTTFFSNVLDKLLNNSPLLTVCVSSKLKKYLVQNWSNHGGFKQQITFNFKPFFL